MIMLMIMLSRTSNARNNNIKRISLQRKILQSLRVPRRNALVASSQFNNFIITICEMINPILANRRHMEKSVQQICSPEGVRLGVGDCVPEGTHGSQRAALYVAQIADDGFVRGGRVAPVAGITC